MLDFATVQHFVLFLRRSYAGYAELENCREEAVEAAFVRTREKLNSALPGEVSFGELLARQKASGVVFKNYNPEDDDREVERGEIADKFCPISRKNPCIMAYHDFLPNSLEKERKRLDKGGVILAEVRFIDAVPASVAKEEYKKEIEKLWNKWGLDEALLYSIGILMLDFHAKHHRCVNGRPLPVVIASANARDKCFSLSMFDDREVFETNLVRICGVMPHGECWVRRMYLLRWDEKGFG